MRNGVRRIRNLLISSSLVPRGTLKSCPKSRRPTFPASQVNRLGNSFGLTETQLLQLPARLTEPGEVELQWGGNVKVMRPRPIGHFIHVERGGTFVQNSVVGAAGHVNLRRWFSGSGLTKQKPASSLRSAGEEEAEA
jgi:hypothetical protein